LLRFRTDLILNLTGSIIKVKIIGQKDIFFTPLDPISILSLVMGWKTLSIIIGLQMHSNSVYG